MNYVSVWSDEDGLTIENTKHCNEWIPFIGSDNGPVIIREDNCEGAHAVISGSNSNLLFITYQPNNISIFDLNTLQYINSTLPIGSDQISSSCTNSYLITNKQIGLRIQSTMFFITTNIGNIKKQKNL
ncbi:hypothetical protein RFI_00512 [Reticulomyxa filosa]|uniref:Uncharacterized protein n=1 Tax=Reticulomyxa filosa TaxID=46433 RepID=X6PEA3_RETFI|nr:hypothetical protein RFI_00512 [Reticulomyxa filosa]|eukprot:ETO36551.1 hypothetical protein RFI_00512 [Reticulomyxa filosa]